MRIAKGLAWATLFVLAGCGRSSSDNLSPRVDSPEVIEQAHEEYRKKAEENAKSEQQFLARPHR